MAYGRNYGNNRKGSKSGKGKSKYTNIEKLAYKMGQIKRGTGNTHSRVYESYMNGLNGKTAKNNKPLF